MNGSAPQGPALEGQLLEVVRRLLSQRRGSLGDLERQGYGEVGIELHLRAHRIAYAQVSVRSTTKED